MSLLFRTLWLATALALTTTIAQAAKSEPAPAPAIPPASLIGLSRDEVVAARGKPTGERARADGSILMVYADGAKIELRDGRVVSVTGIGGAEIVGADGTRYVPGADGNIKRPVIVSDVSAADAAEAASSAAEAGATGGAALKPAAAVAVAEDEDADDAGADAPGGAIEKFVEDAEDPEEEPPPSLVKTLLVLGIDVVFRFAFAVLVLRLSIHFVGVPFFWPDLLKVAVLYLAVREVMHGLGGLGGWWEFIPIFKLDDVTSFIILACSLTWFKIAGSGLTALKIAAMTKFVIVGLMLAVGLAVTFGLSAMQ
ncbi:MAG: hypothetical protein IAE82_21260 [Opitutaceae bacterium]|nr:hypothetical protein [Opitutaceae bacterium]